MSGDSAMGPHESNPPLDDVYATENKIMDVAATLCSIKILAVLHGHLLNDQNISDMSAEQKFQWETGVGLRTLSRRWPSAPIATSMNWKRRSSNAARR